MRKRIAVEKRDRCIAWMWALAIFGYGIIVGAIIAVVTGGG